MRPRRDDFPGAWWHLTNRGIAKRTVFETAVDVARFLGGIALVTKLGLLEVHAYSLLTTHFHLLARSPRGEVSEAMRILQNGFVRWFNRTRRRDGALFRGRFCGRRIDDGTYWETVLRYIDLNAPRARLCRIPSDHVHGSARVYRYGTGPEWLHRVDVERAVCGFLGLPAFEPSLYDEFAASCDPETAAYLVERLLTAPSKPMTAWGDLVRTASPRQSDWMRWKTALADGTAPGAILISPSGADRAARTAARVLRRRGRRGSRPDVARDVRIGLLHHAAGLTTRETAARVGVHQTTAHRALQRHALRMQDNPAYEELVLRILRASVRRAFPQTR